ncbi:hypothetical protein [Arthrobacter sp. Alg241-R88]|uniref:hypothetical protein n=1 Tax=Arthrobacter sp. Alg241-R88 TaxID=2305984 RepID=UPI0013D71D54|nr:hypothetical protein [Arthrobacter sp. Alg241-R88]
MDKWTSSEWLAFWSIVIGGVIAIAAIFFSIWAARRWGNRRGRLLLAYHVTNLMPTGGPREGLGFTYKGMPVNDPQLVTLRLKNVGPHDITRDHFDQNQPLWVGLDATFMGLIRTTSTVGYSPGMAMQAIGTEKAQIGFNPGHLPRKAEWMAEFLVEGTAVPSLRGLLINTDIDEGESGSRKVLRELALMTIPWPGRVLAELLFK